MIVALLLIASAPTALGRGNVDVDVEADVDMSVTARARGEGRLTYAWDWGDGQTSAGARARHQYHEPGVYHVVLTVTDEAGRESRRTHAVEVKAPRPTVDVEVDEDRVVAKADVSARTRVEWDWGDGETSQGRRATHRYEASGTYEIVAKFEDRNGRCWDERRTIVVRVDERDEPPAADEEEDEAERRESRVVVRARSPGMSAHVSFGSERASAHEHDDRAYAWSSSEARLSSHHYERHDAPGVPAPLLLAGIGGLAAAGRKLLRR